MQLKPTHVFYLTFMNYSIQNLLLLPDMLNTAQRDVWISTIVSMVMAFLVLGLLWQFDKNHPGLTLYDVIREGMPSFLYIPLFLALGLYLMLQSIVTTTYLGEFVNIGFLQETPLWVILLVFSLVITYTLTKGIVALANLAGLLTFTTILSGWTMSFAVTGHRDMTALLPILEHGLGPVFQGSLLFAPIWVEVLFLGFLPRRQSGDRTWLKTYIWIAVVNTVLFLGHTVGPISVFGLEQAQNLNFPALSAVKVISLGFIDRFDIYGLMLMIFGSMMRVGMYAYLTLALFRAGFDRNLNLTGSYRVFVPLLAGGVLALTSALLFRDTPFFDFVIRQLVAASLIVLVLFVLTYVIVLMTRRRRMAGQV